MRELEVHGVQTLARRLGWLWVAIGAVADDRMADGGKMDANLVGAPRLELHFDQRAPARLAQLTEARACFAPAPRGRDDSHALALARIAPDRRLDDALDGREVPFDQRKVTLHGGV